MTDWLTQLPINLGGVLLGSFLAATLLPGGSEALLYVLLRQQPEQSVSAVALATLGNTLGGMTTYWMARLLPQKRLPARLALVRDHGSAALLLAWAPVIGDALCAAAGWLRVNWAASMVWMALGKLARYLVVAAAALDG